MLDFKSYIKNLLGKYLVFERHMLQFQGILFQYLKLKIADMAITNFLYNF